MKVYITEIKKLKETVAELIKKNEKMDKEIISLLNQKHELLEKNAEKDEQMEEMLELIKEQKNEIVTLKNEIATLKKIQPFKNQCQNKE
jgi:peptidoglycan hydrolase CwlO-like protein